MNQQVFVQPSGAPSVDHSIADLRIGSNPIAVWVTVTLDNGKTARGGFSLPEAKALLEDLQSAVRRVSGEKP